MPFDFFILNLFQPEKRFYFLAWTLVVIISITLHELAHGIAAVRVGDDTPIRQGRMTLNPLVHMGPYSIIVLLLLGLAWGAMPIDPSRMRGRYAQAKVAFAGPAVNLFLAVASLVAWGLLLRFGAITYESEVAWRENLFQFLFIAGNANLLLFGLNMLPAPPLDGSHILANFHRPYADFISDPRHHGVHMLMFFGVFMLIFAFSPRIAQASAWFGKWVATVGM